MWLTIFPDLEDIHLPKDVVHFGSTSSKFLGVQHSILTYENGVDVNEFSKSGTEILFMKRYFGRAIFDFAIWFICSKYRPDVIQLFHFCRSSCLIALFLKFFCLFSRDPFHVILKLDAGKSTLKGYKYFLFLYCSRFFDTISVETKEIYQIIEKSKVAKKVVLVPNGVLVGDVAQVLQNTSKQNSIIVMSRYGTFQKNTEQLMRVAPIILKKFPNWTFHCFGRIENSFEDQVNNFLTDNQFEGRLVFYGFASRALFEEKLAESKIYLNTSRWEGFSAAFLDARAFGLKIVSSEVNALSEIFDDFQFGYSFPVDCDKSLLTALENAINSDEYFTSDEYKRDADKFVNRYRWGQVVGPLIAKISSVSELNYD